MMNIVQLAARVGTCLLCLLFLLFSETSLPVFATSYQDCLPTVPGPFSVLPDQPGTLFINEILLSSKKTWSCPGSTSVPGSEDNSWIELYNPTTLSFNLYTAHAAIDGGPGTTPVYFPFGSAIAAHGFITIFPYQRTLFPNGVETFTRRLLFNNSPVSAVIDQVQIPPNLGSDQSYARVPDGASKWEITNTPTIGISNILPTATPTVKHSLKSSITKKKSAATPVKTRKGTITTTTSIDTGTISTPGITSMGESNTVPSSNSVQPAWGQLQLPTAPSSPQPTPLTTIVSPPDTTASSPPANNTNTDGPRNVLFIGLAIVLIGTLCWWGRRRFMRS